MSYKQPNTGDTLNDYFTNLAAFNTYAPHLIEAKNLQEFVVWFDKLRLIDRRALLLYLREHRQKIDPAYIKHAQRHFVEKIC